MAETTVVPDAVSADPKHYTIEDENDHVRIVRVRYAPGEKSVMHSHPELVAVFLSEGDIRFTFPDGTTEDAHGTVGQTMFMPALTHLPENTGKTQFDAILIELKH